MNNKLVKGITFGEITNQEQPIAQLNPYMQIELYEEEMLENIEVRRNILANPFMLQALDEVKQLITLPDEYCTTKMVADYFEVPEVTIKILVIRNREELELNGSIVLKGDALKQWKKDLSYIMQLTSNIANPKSSSLTLYNRRTILNIAMLLRDSIIAKTIRLVILKVRQLMLLEEAQKAMNTKNAIKHNDILMKMQEIMNNMNTKMMEMKKE